MTMILFGLITSSALIGVPAFAYLHGYTWLDWTMFAVLYIVTGLGITVGYHRLLAHRSFAPHRTCPRIEPRLPALWIESADRLGLVLIDRATEQTASALQASEPDRPHQTRPR